MADKAQTRTDRLKAALRENLKRRKAQTRGRAGAHESTREGTGELRASGRNRED
jgi:hypothetical protein